MQITRTPQHFIAKLFSYLNLPENKLLEQSFRRIFILKILLWSLLSSYDPANFVPENLYWVLLIFASVLAWSDRNYFFGFSLLLFIKFIPNIYLTYPWTPNHFYLEFIILLLFSVKGLSLYFSNFSESIRPNIIHSMQLIILLVWFHSGLQKLLNGFWLNGELIGTTIHNGVWAQGDSYQTGLIYGLSLSTLFFERLPFLMPGAFEVLYSPISDFQLLFVKFESFLVIALEMLLPILYLFSKYKKISLLGIVIMQIFVSFVSGVFSFGFLSLALLFTFFPTNIKRNYLLLSIAMFSFFIIGMVDRFWLPHTISFWWL